MDDYLPEKLEIAESEEYNWDSLRSLAQKDVVLDEKRVNRAVLSNIPLPTIGHEDSEGSSALVFDALAVAKNVSLANFDEVIDLALESVIEDQREQDERGDEFEKLGLFFPTIFNYSRSEMLLCAQSNSLEVDRYKSIIDGLYGQDVPEEVTSMINVMQQLRDIEIGVYRIELKRKLAMVKKGLLGDEEGANELLTSAWAEIANEEEGSLMYKLNEILELIPQMKAFGNYLNKPIIDVGIDKEKTAHFIVNDLLEQLNKHSVDKLKDFADSIVLPLSFLTVDLNDYFNTAYLRPLIENNSRTRLRAQLAKIIGQRL